MRKFLDKYVWPWKAMVNLKEDLAREKLAHASTKAAHEQALRTIKQHEQVAKNMDGHMRKMARIITLTSGFGS